MYINDSHHTQRTYNQLKELFPNASLPRNETPVIMEDWYYIVETPRPDYDQYTEKLVQSEPEKPVSIYYEVWLIAPLEPSMVASILAREKENKYNDIWGEANSRNDDAERQFNPDENSPAGTTNRNTKQWSKIANKKSKGQSLSSKEEKFDDDYDSMLDYQDSVNDAADQGEDAVELMHNTYNVVAYDPVNDPSWPNVWIKPV